MSGAWILHKSMLSWMTPTNKLGVHAIICNWFVIRAKSSSLGCSSLRRLIVFLLMKMDWFVNVAALRQTDANRRMKTNEIKHWLKDRVWLAPSLVCFSLQSRVQAWVHSGRSRSWNKSVWFYCVLNAKLASIIHELIVSNEIFSTLYPWIPVSQLVCLQSISIYLSLANFHTQAFLIQNTFA